MNKIPRIPYNLYTDHINYREIKHIIRFLKYQNYPIYLSNSNIHYYESHPLWISQFPAILDINSGKRYNGFEECVEFYKKSSKIDDVYKQSIEFRNFYRYPQIQMK
jgi:hypothetical protein